MVETIKQSKAYQDYHARVVSECVRLMGELNRIFFDEVCDYVEEFNNGTDPEEVAFQQQESV